MLAKSKRSFSGLSDDDAYVPIDLVTKHYRQRASTPGTLLIAEATFKAPKAGGIDNFPGIWSDAQVEAWKKVVNAVHAQGSYIFLQLVAMGRVALPAVLSRPDSPSNLGGPYPFVVPPAIPIPTADLRIIPHPLMHEEILEYIDLYGQAVHNVVHRGGFDGIEIYGSKGCLVDQFIQDVSNKRMDQWGGSIENQTRFPLEVIKEVNCTSLNLAWLRIKTGPDSSDSESAYISARGYTPEAAIKAVEKSVGLVAFGRYFTSNNTISLIPYDRSTFYPPKSTYGYADYAFADKESEDKYEKVDKL
ncbi:hypothetical protein ACEPAH_7661 [Sanghuangporus vaninii]